MIVRPKLTSLMEKVDSRYTLVSVVAKRARQLTESDERLVETENGCKVSEASEELAEGKIEYTKNS
ncbi:MAG: DNA-directed RNA polymerase subunit omega [Clostridiales bacterium]|nr:DNA-directed RNA polymerase subunit omega [Clostridiales bacterium]